MANKIPRTPEVEKMIARVAKKKGLSDHDAIEYMLAVATGRLSALWRYSDSLPEGKDNKGVRVAGKRKAAERADAIRVLPKAEEAAPKKAAPKKAAPKKAPKAEPATA